MGFDFRYPNITGKTEREQLAQYKGFLIQLVDQLNFAMNNISSSTPTASSVQTVPASRLSTSAYSGFWTSLGLSSAVSQSNSAFGRHQNGNVWYRVVNENHIYVAFNCKFDFNGETIQVNSSPIPSMYRPERNVYAMCPVNNRGIARILVKPDGNIHIDYVQSMAVGEVTTTYTVNWIDGYIDYWV